MARRKDDDPDEAAREEMARAEFETLGDRLNPEQRGKAGERFAAMKSPGEVLDAIALKIERDDVQAETLRAVSQPAREWKEETKARAVKSRAAGKTKKKIGRDDVMVQIGQEYKDTHPRAKLLEEIAPYVSDTLHARGYKRFKASTIAQYLKGKLR